MIGSTEMPALVDPITREKLVLTAKGLHSKGSCYPVVNGIPRIVPESGHYASAFGDQWNRWSRTQLDSHTGVPISRERLLRCLGTELASELMETDRCFDVLEAGCGAGRFTEILLGMPTVRLTSVDLSNAVDANQLNCPQDVRHRIIQCDIVQPPFLPESFDVVVCLGVIQHTPNPEQTIASLFGMVRPGGWLIIDHYLRSSRQWTRPAAIAARAILKHKPEASRMQACEKMVDRLLPLHRAARKSRTATVALHRISPIMTYFHTYPELSEDLQREWAMLDTHDSLTDWYKHLRTPAQIRTTLEKLGAQEIFTTRGGIGVEARCRRV